MIPSQKNSFHRNPYPLPINPTQEDKRGNANPRLERAEKSNKIENFKFVGEAKTAAPTYILSCNSEVTN